jgi:hypothetical protein
MVESWVLIEGQNVREELRSVSLMNAKHVVVGSVPSGGTILHVAANSLADIGNTLLAFAEVPSFTGVSTEAIRTRQ